MCWLVWAEVEVTNGMKFGWFKSLWGSAKLPYWRQRAAADFPAVTFNEALAALRGHDWAAELDLMDELEATEREFCLPGIGFVLETGCVLHICPNRDGTATSFYLYGGESLHRDGVSPEEQKRLLKLLCKQDRVKLAKAFDGAASSRSLRPKWRALLQALWQVAWPAKIRSHYVIATTALMAGTEAPARERLRTIRSLEAHWRLGASVPVRAHRSGI